MLCYDDGPAQALGSLGIGCGMGFSLWPSALAVQGMKQGN